MKALHLFLFALIACAGAAWAQTEIERDLDGNSSIFQTAPQKTGATDARR